MTCKHSFQFHMSYGEHDSKGRPITVTELKCEHCKARKRINAYTGRTLAKR